MLGNSWRGLSALPRELALHSSHSAALSSVLEKAESWESISLGSVA